jgi:hypothetical protein
MKLSGRTSNKVRQLAAIDRVHTSPTQNDSSRFSMHGGLAAVDEYMRHHDERMIGDCDEDINALLILVRSNLLAVTWIS